jgi:hypothetical protein
VKYGANMSPEGGEREGGESESERGNKKREGGERGRRERNERRKGERGTDTVTSSNQIEIFSYFFPQRRAVFY